MLYSIPHRKWTFCFLMKNGLFSFTTSLIFTPLFLFSLLGSVMCKDGTVVGGYKEPRPSETYSPCHFNSLCYCKYDERTQMQESLVRLWQLLQFNATEFQETVREVLDAMTSGPDTQPHLSPWEVLAFSYVVGNSSSSSRRPLFEPGPVFDMDCSNVPIAQIPIEYSAPGLVFHISVTGSKLTMLDGSGFSGLEVQGIRLSRNDLHFISEFAFSSMGSSLSLLDLSSNSLDEIPFTAFRGLKLLEWLNISNNLLSSLSGDWFSLTGTLRKLLLSSNSLEIVPHSVLRSFSRLSWLDLSRNFIRNLSLSALPPNLQTLNLNRNRFSHFPLSVFYLDSLSWLLLGGCAIESVPENWIPGLGLRQMNQLDLSDNFIQAWPSRAFGAQLTVLDLSVSWNFLGNLPAAAFEGTNAFRLSLGFNRIRRVEPTAFSSLEGTLTYLNLENNELEAVPWESLQNLSSLQHFYMGSNLIRDDNINNLDGTVECKFRYLGLNGNRLFRLPRRLLSRCPLLLHLNLGYNQISDLDEFSHFSNGKLRNLNTLVLRNNPIRRISWHQGHFPTESGNYHVPDAPNGLNRDALNSNQDHNEVRSLDNSGDGESGRREPGSGGSKLHSRSYSITLPSVSSVFRPEVFPNLRELSLSFCQLEGELQSFPTLPLRILEMSMGLKSAVTLGPTAFRALKDLQWLALDHNSIQSISEYAFYSNRKLSYVNLEWNRLTTLPPSLFHPEIHPSLAHIRLSHNKITKISTDSFVSVPVTILDLSYNQIHRVETKAFREDKGVGSDFMAGVSELRAHRNKSPRLRPPLVIVPSGGGSVTLDEDSGLSVFLGHNRISALSPACFELHHFVLVDLSYNHLKVFNFDAVGEKTVVSKLDLSYNQLEQVFIKGRRLLQVLDVSHNRITSKALDLRLLCVTARINLAYNKLNSIQQHHFPTNCSVKELNLEGNLISSLDPTSFTNFRDLTVLRMASNSLTRLPTIVFIRNPKLKLLDLSRNRIRTIPRDGLVGTSIEILKLSSNQFVSLPAGALEQIGRHLKRLDLSLNWIEHLDSTTFGAIPGLLSLNLSSNRISTLPDSAFANLPSLRELDLSYNSLRANFKELFHFLPKLRVLRLCGCGLKVLPYLPLPHLVSLDLTANGLHEIKAQSISSLNRLRSLDLSTNQLVGHRLPAWTSLHRLTSLKLNRNPLKSLTRDTLYGLDHLESLELVDTGRIERFDSDVFSSHPKLRSLAVDTHPNIEKYRFRLGGVLSSILQLEELYVKIKESILSDQLLGGITPKLRRLTITGPDLQKIEPGALEGLQNTFHMNLSITGTSIEEVPPRIFELLRSLAWARLDLSFNKMSSLDSTALYPNKTVWFTRGTKILEGGLTLDGNEFICDCDLVWIGEWLRRWLRESFQSHSLENVPLVHSTYEAIRRPTCTDSKGRAIPLIELYSEVMCHASALSSASTALLSSHLTYRLCQTLLFTVITLVST